MKRAEFTLVVFCIFAPGLDCECVAAQVFMQLEAGGKALGKVAIGLYGNAAPRTVENFVALCKGDSGPGEMGKALSFLGCNFHRIIPGKACSCLQTAQPIGDSVSYGMLAQFLAKPVAGRSRLHALTGSGPVQTFHACVSDVIRLVFFSCFMFCFNKNMFLQTK